MRQHPYSNLPDTRFWSSGVTSPVNAHTRLTIEPLINSLSKGDKVSSGGSCFAQYIGKELTSRNYNYIRSQLSDDRVESFGLGNIYTIAQMKQWLEYSLKTRDWAEESLFRKDNQWYDYLLPHRPAATRRNVLVKHRKAIRDEILAHLADTNVLIFTIGLTESWRNSADDIYPTCPGTVIGNFDESKHFFHNCTYEDICSDLKTVENLLTEINPTIRVVYTVSPVPLTATASDDHVLMATTYSKSIIRAALGHHCKHSERASYFPSYELINHHTETDWRFSKNLRSVSELGVNYVMKHAFSNENATDNYTHKFDTSYTHDDHQEAICEEELLDTYSKSIERSSCNSDIVLLGDSHMGKFASAFEAVGVETIGGMVMNGSGFSDNKFKVTEHNIFTPLESDDCAEIWSHIYDQLVSLHGACHILTNIGFQTHRTINYISAELSTPILTETDVTDYFKTHCTDQIHILKKLSQFGKVWLIEDPNFYAFIPSTGTSMTIRGNNFHQYCLGVRNIAKSLGIGYLNPCGNVLQNQLKDTGTLNDMVGSDHFHGTQTYYERCAAYVSTAIKQ